ncbi:ScbA/BarX family gamma-butyrolactone biosynthesis protein [Streptomyces vilmorinianum]|uniref:ScbA/BarX family gamma-butyrolactone biosynthesis protein n=1 Tax=Streptomyces vilmorinianum TaxID=3051092 RepID=UPI0020C747F2|nr:ScbA/BarX family gamma-butyrolactone biosynthesis protein [Streptomyces vilmorinianum]
MDEMQSLGTTVRSGGLGTVPDPLPHSHDSARAWRGDVTSDAVHRTDPADIFPTGWAPLTDTRYSVSAHWPLTHRFYAPVSDSHQDPLLVAETMRQTAMLLAHREFGVPVGDQFVMWDLWYDASPTALALDGTDAEITVDVICSDIKRRGRGLSGMYVSMVLTRAGQLLATGGGRISCTSAPAYRRLRGDRMALVGAPVPLLPALPPRAVGRVNADDVVLAPTDRPNAWRLRLNTGHPTLFSRPNDHVPGMLLVEAARQAATAVGSRRTFLPTSLEISFSRYVELDSPCWIEAQVLPSHDPSRTTVRITGVQDGEPVFVSTLTAPAQAPDRAEELAGTVPRPRSGLAR